MHKDTIKCCLKKGPGYKSPEDAIKNGGREKVLFVTCPNTKEGEHDIIACVDVDPESETFTKVINYVKLPYENDEVHHSGWNTCSSCYDDSSLVRSHLIIPCLNSSRIYVINTKDPKNLKIDHIVEPEKLLPFNVSFLHTSHCLADGNIMISTLGDNDGNARGNFILLDGKTFEPKKTWIKENTMEPKFNYDFWYQPRQNVMISTEWGTPNAIKDGFKVEDVIDGQYGNKIHIFKWNEKEICQSIELPGPEGQIPLEVRFLHDPTKWHAFVGTALGSSIFHIYDNGNGEYKCRLAASINPVKVSGWAMDVMPPLITDIIISMDDKYLYASCWLHGIIKQYDISDPFNFVLNSEINISGSLHSETNVKILDEDYPQPNPTYINGTKIEGGPQMLQLSLDGKRLYVSNSLYLKWDQQFYPDLASKGGNILKININEENGKMTLDENFVVDLTDIDGSSYLPHEMRYPGGDCTSDIWL
uniref:Methanethiol oxidase n=1 Tax=Strongyloides papillosus TaxID=174720 RepID=A0A0N5CD00_STREA